MDSTTKASDGGVQLDRPYEPYYFLGLPSGGSSSHNNGQVTNRVTFDLSNGPFPTDRKHTPLTKLPTPIGSLGNDYNDAAVSLVNPILYKPPHPSRIRPPAQFKRSVGRPRKCYSGNAAALRRQQQNAFALDDAIIAGVPLLSSDVTLRPPILNPSNLAHTLANQITTSSANGNAQQTARSDMTWPNTNPAHPKFAGAANFTRYENGTPQVQAVGGIHNQIINSSSHMASYAQRQPTTHIILPAPAHMASGATSRTTGQSIMAQRAHPAIIASNASTYAISPQQPFYNVEAACLLISQFMPYLKMEELADQLSHGNVNARNLTLPSDINPDTLTPQIAELVLRCAQKQDLRQQIPPPQQPPLTQQPSTTWSSLHSSMTATTASSTNNPSVDPRSRERKLEENHDDIVRQDLDAGADGDEEFHEVETYSDYEPSKVKIGKPHPDPVVETSSLATAEPPDITYSLKLPSKIMDQALLSALQLESVIYASQQHSEKMPDQKTRRGFLIGDGAGVGKGRTIAGIIYENYLNGRKKSIWLSVSTDLKLDAERDLKDIGAKIPVFLLGRYQYGRRINEDHGVIFSTYSGLISKSHSIKGQYSSRMGQLIAWAGNNFDGVIVFDECHKAKNISLVGTKGAKKISKAAEFVLDLQNKLPNARVVYASATGASETRHLGYMTRLAIWGPGTPYPDFTHFCGCIEKRGVGAMELVAVELKMRGSYIARQLSFKTTSFCIEYAPLSKDFISLYDSCVDMWTLAFRYFREAEGYVKSDKKIVRTLWSSFWAAHQKFFKYLCISIKVPVVEKIAEKAIADGKCVIVGLQSTGEAKTLEALEEGDVNEFISTARATFESLIDNHFPAPKKARRRRRVSASTDSDINPMASVTSEQSTSSSSCVDETWARDPCKFFVKDGITLPVIDENLKLGHTTRPSRSVAMISRERQKQALKALIEEKEKKTKSARNLRHKRRLAATTKSRVKKPTMDSDTDLSNPSHGSSPNLLSDDDDDFFVDDDDDDDDTSGETSDTVTESDGSDDDLKVIGTKSASKQKFSNKKFINDDSDDDDVQITAVKPVVTINSEGEASDVDEEGEGEEEQGFNPIAHYGPRLTQMQDELYARIDEIGPNLPNNTLDDLIHRLGGPDKVAEMTGRKGRLVKDQYGRVTYRARNEVDASDTLNIEEKKRFMDGTKLIAIISEAASSGISLQADRRVQNKRRRVHITIELPWSADRAVQQFGRSHRSNQVSGPEYVFIISELSGERRFASVVAKRLESLGALTHGDRRATSDQRNLSQFNITSKYCRESLEKINAYLGDSQPIGDLEPAYEGNFIKDTRDAYLAVGLAKLSYGHVFQFEPVSLSTNIFLNRILGMKVQVQNALFDLFSKTMDRLILRQKVTGKYDSGILELTSESGKTRVSDPEMYTIRTISGYIKCSLRFIQVERGISWERAKEIYEQDTGGDRRSGFYISANVATKAKLVILAIREGVDLFRVYKPNVGRQAKPDYYVTISEKFRQVGLDRAAQQWRFIYETTHTQCVHQCYFNHCKRKEASPPLPCDVGMRHRNYCMLSGAIMTTWPYLEGKKYVEKMEIIRLRTEDSREIGPKIPQDSVAKVREALKRAQVDGINF